MLTEPRNKRITIIFIIILIALFVTGVVSFKDNNTEQIGSIKDTVPAGYVSTTTASGITFAYPPEFPTTYIYAFDWPPQIQLEDRPFVCTNAGHPEDRAGESHHESEGAREYCVTRVSDAAAGSRYNQYAYTTTVNTKVVTLTFTTRLPQCMNYDEPQQSACQQEQNTFELLPIVDAIVETIRF